MDLLIFNLNINRSINISGFKTRPVKFVHPDINIQIKY